MVTHAERSATRCLAGLASCGMLIAGAPRDANAQSPFDGWREPVVVELEVAGGKDGERLRALGGRRIQLGPRERFQLGVELDRECDGRVSVSDTGSGNLRFSAGRSRGRCRALVYVPGNLNLEFELEFEVTGIGATNYTRRQAEEIANRLYRAILQREVEPSARAAAVAEIQRGRIDNQVGSMLDSREFVVIRQRTQPAEILEAFYAGLLDRAPDSAGADDYLREINRGQFRVAIMNLVQSQEFETSLPSR